MQVNVIMCYNRIMDETLTTKKRLLAALTPGSIREAAARSDVKVHRICKGSLFTITAQDEADASLLNSPVLAAAAGVDVFLYLEGSDYLFAQIDEVNHV